MMGQAYTNSPGSVPPFILAAVLPVGGAAL